MTIKKKIKSNKITLDHLDEFKGKDVIITIEESDNYTNEQKQMIKINLEQAEKDSNNGNVFTEEEVDKIIENW